MNIKQSFLGNVLYLYILIEGLDTRVRQLHFFVEIEIEMLISMRCKKPSNYYYKTLQFYSTVLLITMKNTHSQISKNANEVTPQVSRFSPNTPLGGVPESFNEWFAIRTQT